MSMRGFERRDIFIGDRHHRFSMTLSVMLRGGVTYALVGACDDDCYELNFRLFDAAGREVARDTRPHDNPVVKVMPCRTQVYQLRVVTSSRTPGHCSFGIGLYALD